MIELGCFDRDRLRRFEAREAIHNLFRQELNLRLVEQVFVGSGNVVHLGSLSG